MNKFEPAKFSRLYKIGKIIIAIGYYMSIIFVPLLLIFAVYCFIEPNSHYQLSTYCSNGNYIFDLGGQLKYNVDITHLPGDISVRRSIIVSTFSGILHSLVMIYIFTQLRGIISKVDQKEPFHKENGNRLRNMAVAILGASFLFPAITTLNSYLIIDELRLTSLSVFYSEDDLLLLIGLLLLMLSTIFNYGCYLQTEYDETI